MKNMFRNFTLVIGLLGACALSAHGQQYRYAVLGGLDGTTTNSVEGQAAWLFPSGSTTNYWSSPKNDSFTLMLVYRPYKCESNLVTLHWQVSPDPEYWPQNLGATNATQTGVWTVGTGHLTNSSGLSMFVTNVTMGTIGYWRCSAISNNMASGSYITNMILRAYCKPVRAN